MVLDGQKKTLIIVVLVIIILGSLAQIISVLSKTPKIVDSESYLAKAEIGETSGVSINDTVAEFGRIPPFSASRKRIQVANPFDETLLVVAEVRGELSEMVEIVPNYVQLKPQERTELTAQFNSGNNSFGNYTGEIVVMLVSLK